MIDENIHATLNENTDGRTTSTFFQGLKLSKSGDDDDDKVEFIKATINKKKGKKQV